MNLGESEIMVLKNEIERLKNVLHRDRVGLAEALAKVREEVRSRIWVVEGRGAYRWDDDRYRKEAGYALNAIDKIAHDALVASGTLAHAECCGRTATDFPERRAT